MNAIRFSLSLLALGLLGGPLGAQFRSVDGHGNHPVHPEYGGAGIPLLRVSIADYADGHSQPAGPDRPGARAISNALLAQSGSIPNEASASDFVWQWGQFLDHDLDLTESAAPLEPLDIPVPL